MDLVTLLLCGGASRRFGGGKLLADHGGRPLVAGAAGAALASGGRVLAIVPPDAASLVAALRELGCETFATDRCARGLGGSLAAGVEAAAGADGWIVMLGDMPAIRAATVSQVKRALQGGAAIAVPVDAAGRRGHPVGFAASMRAELLALDADVGARDVLARHARDVHAVVTDDPGIFVDVDTPTDLARIRR